MAINTHYFEGEGTQEFSDETIRRFLLGELSAAEQPLFEQRLFTDDRLEARIHLVECELADDYAYGRLNGAERELLEEKFLVSEDRQRKVEVSRVLRDRFASVAVVARKATFAAGMRSLFRFTRPAWRIAFGVLILLILFGTVWLVIREPRIVQQIANRITPRRSLPRTEPREVHHPTNASSPEHATTPAPMPEHDQTASSRIAASIVLMPDVSYVSEMVPSVNLPRGEKDVVRLRLVLKPDQQGPYRAGLLTIQGQSVFSADLLQSADSRAEVDFDVPASLLNAGDYQIRLGRSDRGSQENVANYYFRAR